MSGLFPSLRETVSRLISTKRPDAQLRAKLAEDVRQLVLSSQAGQAPNEEALGSVRRQAELIDLHEAVVKRNSALRDLRRAVIWLIPTAFIIASMWRLSATEGWIEVQAEALTFKVANNVGRDQRLFSGPILVRRISFARINEIRAGENEDERTVLKPALSIGIDGCDGDLLRVENPKFSSNDLISIAMDHESADVIEVRIDPGAKRAYAPEWAVTALGCHVVRGLPPPAKQLPGKASASYVFRGSGARRDARISLAPAGLRFALPANISGLSFQRGENQPGDAFLQAPQVRSGRLEFDSVRELKVDFRDGQRLAISMAGTLSTLRLDGKVLLVRAHGTISQLHAGFQRMTNIMPTALDWVRSYLREGSIGFAILYALLIALSRKDFLNDAAKNQLHQ